MWSRRDFLETLSGVPLIGGLVGTAAVAGTAPVQAASRDYFGDLGIKPFINAAGTYTDMTASLMPEEVRAAWEYAAQHFVPLNDLHDRIGERIATLVKAEAAMVTSGAAAAMTLGTAGVLTGTDRQKVVHLPNLVDMKTEVIIQKAHRFGYDHAVRNCGVRLIEVETADELERALTWHTAMMLFYNNNNSEGKIRDEEFVRLGKKHGIPTLNDCAADVPPVENLWKYTAMGFDLVAFSGGKGLRGPQSAGLLVGRKDLVAAARMNAAPNGDSIGRGMKVNKEEMLAMLVALETYLARDHAKEMQDFQTRAETIRQAVTTVPGVTAEIFVPEVANHVPHVRVKWDAAARGVTPTDLSRMLREGTPSIGVRPGDELLIGVWMMRPGEAEVVAKRLKEVLEKKS
ncbi:MAG: aminotransferase class V-fold PLP-dependent enzyme [Acidobacteria bacterium]|nr:aminotransferase class V-fold PLP-dependent enzyme [Acidobacteriota bacterium]